MSGAILVAFSAFLLEGGIILDKSLSVDARKALSLRRLSLLRLRWAKSDTRNYFFSKQSYVTICKDASRQLSVF